LTTTTTHRARALRRNATNAERLLWSRLRRCAVEGFRFRRQMPLQGYIVDFACLEARLIVEVDGATHSSDREIAYDQKRDAVLRADGFAVLRATNDDVFNNLEGVLETVRLRLLELQPPAPHTPSPLVGEGRGGGSPQPES
jgi:very-short-patch-repair endonuclease